MREYLQQVESQLLELNSEQLDDSLQRIEVTTFFTVATLISTVDVDETRHVKLILTHLPFDPFAEHHQTTERFRTSAIGY